MPKFLADINMSGNDINMAGGRLLNVKIPELDEVMNKVKAVELTEFLDKLKALPISQPPKPWYERYESSIFKFVHTIFKTACHIR